MDERKDPKNFKVVYTIIDRGEGQKNVWMRIGTAWVNRDQSLNVKLDAHPANGQLHIRDYEPYDASRRGSNPGAFAAEGRVS